MTAFPLSTVEALDTCAVLREKATLLRNEAGGKIHNAKLGRLDDANRLEALAERMEVWAHAEMDARNKSQSAGVRKMMAGRKAARAAQETTSPVEGDGYLDKLVP